MPCHIIPFKNLKNLQLYWGIDESIPFYWDEHINKFSLYIDGIQYTYEDFKPYKKCIKPIPTVSKEEKIERYREKIKELYFNLSKSDRYIYKTELISLLNIKNKYQKQVEFLMWYSRLSKSYPGVLKKTIENYKPYASKIKGDGVNYFKAILKSNLNRNDYESINKTVTFTVSELQTITDKLEHYQRKINDETT